MQDLKHVSVEFNPPVYQPYWYVKLHSQIALWHWALDLGIRLYMHPMCNEYTTSYEWEKENKHKKTLFKKKSTASSKIQNHGYCYNYSCCETHTWGNIVRDRIKDYEMNDLTLPRSSFLFPYPLPLFFPSTYVGRSCSSRSHTTTTTVVRWGEDQWMLLHHVSSC